MPREFDESSVKDEPGARETESDDGNEKGRHRHTHDGESEYDSHGTSMEVLGMNACTTC